MNNSYQLDALINYFNNIYICSKLSLKKKPSVYINCEFEKKKLFNSTDKIYKYSQSEERKKFDDRLNKFGIVAVFLSIFFTVFIISYISIEYDYSITFFLFTMIFIITCFLYIVGLFFYIKDMDKEDVKKLNADYMLYRLNKDDKKFNLELINSLLDELHQHRLYPSNSHNSLTVSGLLALVGFITKENKSIAFNLVPNLFIYSIVAFISIIISIVFLYLYVTFNESQKDLVITHFYLTTLKDYFLDNNLK